MSERERTFGRETSGWLGKTLTHLNEELYNATSGIFIFDFYACIHEHGVEREREGIVYVCVGGRSLCIASSSFTRHMKFY